jgi:hypothetical protein
MACHFIDALKIPSLRTIKSALHNVRDDVGAIDDEIDDDDEDENDLFDVDTSMDIEAAEDDQGHICHLLSSWRRRWQDHGFYCPTTGIERGYTRISEEDQYLAWLQRIGDQDLGPRTVGESE